MESEAKEASQSPAGTNRLKSVLSKARRTKKENNASTVSIAVTEDSSEGPGSGARNSIDSLVASRQSSLDDGTSTKFAKLIPGRVKRKRRKQEAAEAAERQQQEDELGRGRDTSDQIATAAELRPNAPNRSHSTLDGDEGSSLMTVDSDAESPLGSPPPLVSRQSHAGYLTASSPLIKTSTVGDRNSSDLGDTDGASSQPHPSKSSTFPNSPSFPPSTNLAPRHAATLGPESQERTSKRSPSRDGRGISPGTRIKDIFSTTSQKKDSRSSESPERDVDGLNGSATSLGITYGKEKKNSVSSRKGSKISDINPAAKVSQTSLQSPNSSIQSLPPISTSPKSIASTVSEAPTTFITPPTPTDQLHGFENESSRRASTAPNGAYITPSSTIPSHRRVRSDGATHAPSKLSNAMAPPLTPTVEEVKTPGGRTPSAASSSGGAGGFFSSVFSVAQNAATNFSDIMGNNPSRSRSSTQVIEERQEDQEPAPAANGEDEAVNAKKPMAIDTLGSGDLSLSHLGISSDTPATGTSSTGTFPSLAHRDEAAARAEHASAARAVSAAYSEPQTFDSGGTPVAEDNAPSIKPRSINESSVTGDKTPPTGSIFEGQSGTRRSGSVRSKVGAVARRKRNSSTATAGTGATIAAALGASHAGLANPSAAGSTPKLTGFAVANKKRNRDFHNSFRSVPEDDYLIEDYSCALQREIILAGRVYISEGHICFSSNILGWVTTLIVNFDEVVSVEKENTAMVFPNAIAIQTLHARHTFRSLLSREATYDLIIGIWKLSHPNLKSTLNGAQLDPEATGDKTVKMDPSGSDAASDGSEDEEEVYDEDEEADEASVSFVDADGEVPVSENGEPLPDKGPSRKASAMGVAIGAAAGGVPTVSDAKAGERAAVAASANADFPGPATHVPTECTDADTHYEKLLKDEVIPAPLGKVYSMVFGPTSGGFMSKWLLDEIKVTELQMEDRRGLSEDVRTRTFSYIKPLYAAIGPKSTKCLISETLDFIDLERSISVTSTTQTPDVPSGNVFSTKTKFCFMWAPGNATRIVMSCMIEWTGKSWLKGPIEKGANEGQTSYANDLVKALKAGVSTRQRAATVGSKTKTKGKRPKGSPSAAKQTGAEEKSSNQAKTQNDSWGLLEPLHGILGPVVDIFKPFISANMVIGFLLLVIVVSWLRGPRVPSAKNQLGISSLSGPERIAAYEEIWRREESGLWDWLEDRIGMQDFAYPSSSSGAQDQVALKKARKQRQKSLKDSIVKGKLAYEAMGEREMDHAIKVTEERLLDLKHAVQKRKTKSSNNEDWRSEDPDGGTDEAG